MSNTKTRIIKIIYFKHPSFHYPPIVKYGNLDFKHLRFRNIQQGIQLFWYSFIFKYKIFYCSWGNHLQSALGSQCSKIHLIPTVLTQKYGSCVKFNLKIWQVDIKKKDVWKSWILNIQVFVYDCRWISKRQPVWKSRIFEIQVFIFYIRQILRSGIFNPIQYGLF